MRGLTWPSTKVRPFVIVSVLVFALAGLMFAAAAQASRGTDLRAERATELRDLVRQKSLHVQALETRVMGQQQAVDDLTAGRSGDPSVAAARNGIAALSTEAGLSPIEGRALTVSLDDAPAREPDDPLWQSVTADDVIVHQSDVLAVINALWRGGAKGIQVMDQRIINTSAIQCVGNTLLLHGRVYSPPFTISAVGPVKKMRKALRTDPAVSSYRAWARVVGLGYDVKRTKDTTLPAYAGPLSADYASTAQ